MTAPGGLIGQMREVLLRELAPAKLDIRDDSAQHAGHPGASGGGHYRVALVSERFRGCSRIERHRLVYAAVGPLMGAGIHALSIEARTPEEADTRH
jgi:BolA protein